MDESAQAPRPNRVVKGLIHSAACRSINSSGNRASQGLTSVRNKPAGSAGLNDKDLPACGVDPDAEAGQIAIPEDGILVGNAQGIHGTFGESELASLRYASPALRYP